MQLENHDVEITIELIPILNIFGKNFLIKLQDSAYGEWLIFENNLPLFYLNIFDPLFVKLKEKIELKQITIDDFIKNINIKFKKHYSIDYKYFGVLNYKKKEIQNIVLSKLPLKYIIFPVK